jgi:hypothetical protein
MSEEKPKIPETPAPEPYVEEQNHTENSQIY